ncbi:MAG: shikimate kinase AroK [Gammaproteobacteria bacterium]|nr:shikimate kinase AroK [Gammaproteobacteria bacterium]
MITLDNIFLVGPMGAGKSTIGKQLARALHLDFVDSDREIEKRTGVDIPLIFELEGETGFRKREATVIDQLTQQNKLILATGGGAVLDKNNRSYLSGRGYIIYLQTSVDQQVKRTSRDTKRPLLKTDNPRQRLQDLMDIRDPLYREIADLVVDTDGLSVKTVTLNILKQIDSSWDNQQS